LPKMATPASPTIPGELAGGERKLGVDVRLVDVRVLDARVLDARVLDVRLVDVRVRRGAAVRAAGTAGLGASAERFVDDTLDGARASPAFGRATEATIDLLRVTRQVFRGADSAADIVVGQDVAGTNNHEKRQASG